MKQNALTDAERIDQMIKAVEKEPMFYRNRVIVFLLYWAIAVKLAVIELQYLDNISIILKKTLN